MKRIKFIIKSGFLLFILFFYSCLKDENTNRVEDYFYLRNEGADMPVYVEGNLSSNTFIIILHGGPGGNSHIYNTGLKNVSDRLEDNFVMVYYDQRGAGTSMGNYKARDLTVEKHVEDLNLLISLLNDKYGSTIKIFLLGHSWGGTLGTAYLLQRNAEDIISGWIEVDGAHNFFGINEIIESFKTIGKEQIDSSNSVDFWEEVIAYCEEVDTNSVTSENISKLNRYGYKAENKLTSDGIIQYNTDSTDLFQYFGGVIEHYFFSPYDPLTSTVNLYFSSSGFGMFDEVKDIDYTDKLENIQIPTLILWGRYDMVIPVELGEQAFEYIGTSEKEIFIFETAGHSPMITDPLEFTKKVINFVQRYN